MTVNVWKCDIANNSLEQTNGFNLSVIIYHKIISDGHAKLCKIFKVMHNKRVSLRQQMYTFVFRSQQQNNETDYVNHKVNEA